MSQRDWAWMLRMALVGLSAWIVTLWVIVQAVVWANEAMAHFIH
jgi:hypothetical protein